MKLSILVVTLLGARAFADPAIAVDGCSLDASDLGRALAVELPDAPPVAVTVTCHGDEVTLGVTRTDGKVVRALPVDPPLRARELATAVAEILHAMDDAPPAPPPPPTAAALIIRDDAEAPPILVAPRVRPPRVPLYRGLTIGLGAAAVGAAAASLFLDDDHPETEPGEMHRFRDRDLRSNIALGVSAAALVGSAVSFGLWMHARSSTPDAVIDARPLPGGGAMNLRVKF